MSSKRPKIVRKNGRIYFGVGDEAWSLTDPETEIAWDSEGMANDLWYLIGICPDTKTAVEKLRLIRYAIRNVQITPTVAAVGRTQPSSPR